MDQIERPKTTNPSVTITSLPPELIIAILELYRFQDRFQTLNAVSLVGKGLTAPAQSLLWRSVNIEREEEARSIISSPVFGRYATEAAEVFGHSGGCLESFTLTELLAGRRGLRRLDLSQLVNSEQEINPSLLALPSLASAFLKDRRRPVSVLTLFDS